MALDLITAPPPGGASPALEIDADIASSFTYADVPPFSSSGVNASFPVL